MRRYVLSVILACIGLLLLLPGNSFAAADDDIPGVPLSMGNSFSQTVSAGDGNDVYAVDLVAGAEVHIRCVPAGGGNAEGALRLLVPGAATVSSFQPYSEIGYVLGGIYVADYDYVPAKSGTYYLWVQWVSGNLGYTLSCTRTARTPLDLAPESDDVPGVAAGPGTISQVVSMRADPNDVYAVRLTTGQPVTVRLTPLTPFDNTTALTYLSILDPSTTSLANHGGHRVTDRVLARNDRSAANRQTAEVEYTPTQTGTYYVWVQADALSGRNFAYRLSISGGAQPLEGFLDVLPGSDYEEAIYALVDAGAVTGFPDQTFRPDAPLIRQQFAKMIVKTLNLPVTGNEICPFTDVPAQIGLDPWYPSKYVAVCADHEITKGLAEDTFDPWGFITAQQLITMVTRAADLPEPPEDYTPPFLPSQFDPSEHYFNARRAANAGLLDGLVGVGPEYDFFASATRAECAQVLYNLLLRSTSSPAA